MDRRGISRHLIHRPRRQPLRVAYIYFETEPGRRAAAKLLTGDEARPIAAIIAKLPELVRKGKGRLGVLTVVNFDQNSLYNA